MADFYRAKWSDAVHDEWIRALRRRRPDIPAARLERTRDEQAYFVAGAAHDRAREPIADHERTILFARNRQALLAALDAPPEPTDALRQAVARHATRTILAR